MQRTAIYHTVSLQMELKEESSLSIGKLKIGHQIQQPIPKKGIPNFHEFLDQFEQVLQTFLIVFLQKHILIQNSWVWNWSLDPVHEHDRNFGGSSKVSNF